MSIAEKLQTIAENEQRVYEAGIEEGKQAEVILFWNTYQDYGNRTDYTNAYAEGNSGTRWVNGVTYRPLYPMKPKLAQAMYFGTKLPYEELKKVDFSTCTDLYQTFAYGTMTQLGIIDMSKATRANVAFDTCSKLHTIDKIISSAITTFVSNTFRGCTALVNVLFEGVIAKNGLDVSPCTLLTHDSLMSIINCLKDGVSGLTATLGATNLAKLTDAEKAIATQKGWTLL